MKKVFLIIALFFPLVVLIGWTGWLGTTRGLRPGGCIADSRV